MIRADSIGKLIGCIVTEWGRLWRGVTAWTALVHWKLSSLFQQEPFLCQMSVKSVWLYTTFKHMNQVAKSLLKDYVFYQIEYWTFENGLLKLLFVIVSMVNYFLLVGQRQLYESLCNNDPAAPYIATVLFVISYSILGCFSVCVYCSLLYNSLFYVIELGELMGAIGAKRNCSSSEGQESLEGRVRLKSHRGNKRQTKSQIRWEKEINRNRTLNN